MKKIKFLLIAILSVTLFNCGSDDSPAAELSTDTIAGTYDITLYQGTTEESTTTSSGSQSVIETTTFSGDTFTNAIFTFSSAGTFTNSGDYRESITVTNSSGTTSDSSIEMFDDSGTFSVNSASRTITLNGNIYDVTSFNGTNLNITTTQQSTVNGNTLETELRYSLVKRN